MAQHNQRNCISTQTRRRKHHSTLPWLGVLFRLRSVEIIHLPMRPWKFLVVVSLTHPHQD